jgi:hypothetical protein
VDDAFGQDLSPQTSAMNQTAHDAMLREFLQILARLTKARAAHEHRTDAKFTVDEMIQWDTQSAILRRLSAAATLIPSRPPGRLSTPARAPR